MSKPLTHLTKAETTALKQAIQDKINGPYKENGGYNETVRRVARKQALNEVLALLGETPDPNYPSDDN